MVLTVKHLVLHHQQNDQLWKSFAFELLDVYITFKKISKIKEIIHLYIYWLGRLSPSGAYVVNEAASLFRHTYYN